jgi:hypothetical protein
LAGAAGQSTGRFPNFESQILIGHKNALKSLVDAEAQVLALRIKTAKTREEQLAIITAETDLIRFFTGNSGYFFHLRHYWHSDQCAD